MYCCCKIGLKSETAHTTFIVFQSIPPQTIRLAMIFSDQIQSDIDSFIQYLLKVYHPCGDCCHIKSKEEMKSQGTSYGIVSNKNRYRENRLPLGPNNPEISHLTMLNSIRFVKEIFLFTKISFLNLFCLREFESF